MPATLGSMVEGVLDTLYGHAAVQDVFTSLSIALDDTSTTLTVADASEVGSGLIEIDTELLRVASVDMSGNTVTLLPKGRGVRGTTATSHEVGSDVRVAPVIPYASAVREVNAEISSLFPRISAVATTEFDASTTTITYGLPADAVTVLDVRWRNPAGHWDRVRHWEVEFSQNTTDHPTGRTIRAVTPDVGKIRVIYGKPFTALSALSDTLASAGVPDSCEDVIRMGTIIRLLPSMDLARYSTVSVPSSDANNKPPQPGTGVMVAREMKQQYVARLEQEVGKFRLEYPSRVHFTR